MTEVQAESQAYRGVYKKCIEAVCTAVDSYARVAGVSQSAGDVMLLELAKEIKMKPDGRAARYLDHFLYGDGSTQYFAGATLLNEDVGVRKRLSDTIQAQLKSQPSLAKKRVCGGDYIVPIRQRDFVMPDWQLAIGSFPLEWEVVNLASDRRRIFARITGANEYKWHPTADRVTKCLHEAGDRLSKEQRGFRGRNFWMVALPCVVVIATGKPVA